MRSVSVRRSTCKAPGVFGANRVDLVSFGFQPDPPDPENGGVALEPLPTPKASSSCSWQLCPAQLHSLNQLLHPQGACRAGLCPQEVAGLSSTGPGPLLGSTGQPQGPGTQGHRCAEERLETPQCGPSSRSHIPPGVTPVPGALLCSILSLSLPRLLSDRGKQTTICDFSSPCG